MEIIPGILEKEWENVEKKLLLVKPFARTVHIDLLDGIFAPNTTLQDPNPFSKYSEDIFFELHMMVSDPRSQVEAWGKAGIKRFIGQIEMMDSQNDFVIEAKKYGEAVLAVDAPTSADQVHVDLTTLDGLFVMTVKAGFSNQSFLPECLEKVRFFREQTDISIEVDGGINDKTAREAFVAGADRAVSTGYLFNQGEPSIQFERLCQITSGKALKA